MQSLWSSRPLTPTAVSAGEPGLRPFKPSKQTRGQPVAPSAFSPLFQEFPSPQVRARWASVGPCRPASSPTLEPAVGTACGGWPRRGGGGGGRAGKGGAGSPSGHAAHKSGVGGGGCRGVTCVRLFWGSRGGIGGLRVPQRGALEGPPRKFLLAAPHPGKRPSWRGMGGGWG